MEKSKMCMLAEQATDEIMGVKILDKQKFASLLVEAVLDNLDDQFRAIDSLVVLGDNMRSRVREYIGVRQPM